MWIFLSTILSSCISPNMSRYPIHQEELENVVSFSKQDQMSTYRRLQQAGFITGEYNAAQLSQAVEQFQKAAGIPADGRLNQETWSKVQKLYDPGTAVQKKTISQWTAPSGTAIQQADTKWPESIVLMTQNMLHDLNFMDNDPDGEMDKATHDAIAGYQKKYGLAITANLNTKTIASLLSKACSKDCSYEFTVYPDDIALLASVPWSVHSLPENLRRLLIEKTQTLVNVFGYDNGTPDGIAGPKTIQAIKQFQKDNGIESSVAFSKETVIRLFENYFKRDHAAVTFDLRKKQDKPTPFIEEKQPEGNETFFLPPVRVSEKAYAVEATECSDLSGDWLKIFKGTVLSINAETIELRLENRYSYRYHPNKDGIDDTDWYCIPKRRHCYSQVQFTDWNGAHIAGEIVSFTTENVYSAKNTMQQGSLLFLKKKCNR